jgi:rubredoxin
VSTDQLAMALLPDLPGLAHGIVQVDPFIRIQCDSCGFIYDGEPGKDPKRPDRRRLCRSCRAVEWAEAS